MPNPLTDNDIIAARYRAAESGVPWDRANALKSAIEVAAKKRAAREADAAALRATQEAAAAMSRRQRRFRVAVASLGALLFLAAILGWWFTRR